MNGNQSTYIMVSKSAFHYSLFINFNFDIIIVIITGLFVCILFCFALLCFRFCFVLFCFFVCLLSCLFVCLFFANHIREKNSWKLLNHLLPDSLLTLGTYSRNSLKVGKNNHLPLLFVAIVFFFGTMWSW